MKKDYDKLAQKNEELLNLIHELQTSNSNLQKKLALYEQELLSTHYKLMDAQQADKRQLEFICYLSHEVKTPLNAINGFTSLIKEAESPGSKMYRYCENILKASKHLYQIFSDCCCTP